MEKLPTTDDLKNKNIHSLVLLMAFTLGITFIVLIQRIISDLSNFLLSILNQNNISLYSASTTKALVSTVITVPLFILSIFFYLAQKNKQSSNPYKISVIVFLTSMVVNIFMTVYTIIAFLYEINPTFAAYAICIILIAALVFGIVKIQNNMTKQS